MTVFHVSFDIVYGIPIYPHRNGLRDRLTIVYRVDEPIPYVTTKRQYKQKSDTRLGSLKATTRGGYVFVVIRFKKGGAAD